MLSLGLCRCSIRCYDVRSVARDEILMGKGGGGGTVHHPEEISSRMLRAVLEIKTFERSRWFYVFRSMANLCMLIGECCWKCVDSSIHGSTATFRFRLGVQQILNYPKKTEFFYVPFNHIGLLLIKANAAWPEERKTL